MADAIIHRPIKFHLEVDDPAHTATATPRALCGFMTALASGNLHSAFVVERVMDLLATVSDAEMLPRYLPVNYYARDLDADAPAVCVWHKPGAVTGVRNDVGIIRQGEESLAVCIFTRDCPDPVWTPANRGSEAVARATRLLYDYFFSGPDKTKPTR
jgi:hypothetical protein